jgi:phosphoglycerate dehydrogenase-like enzyme
LAKKKIKVLITWQFDDPYVHRFNDISHDLEILFRPARTYTDIQADTWASAEVLYTLNIFPPAESMPNLKWVQVHSAGVDRVLKQPVIAEQPDLLLTTTSGIHATNIAEYALGFILMFGHRVPDMMASQQEKEWTDERFEKFMPLELRRATVGIVGYGAIGREVARLVKTFGGKVLASKRDAKTVQDREHFAFEDTGDPEGEMFDRLYPPQALATMVRDCDFVVITLPFTEHTANLFDEKVVKAMKPGSYLINVGRGGIVDEDAVLEGLQSGHIAGAAFDVFNEEPLPEDHPFWEAPNMIITPHISGNTPDYNAKAALVFEENLRRYVEKEPLLNNVNREVGY